MIKKLRRKFILIAMCATTFVWLVLIGVINVMNYVKIDRNSDNIVDVLAENDGTFPVFLPGPSDKWNGITPETPFEIRYFTAMLDENGEILSLDMKRIAALSADEAKEYVSYLSARGKTHGMYKDYKYTSITRETGSMYILLDCGKDLYLFRNFLLMSALIGIGSLIVIFLLVVVLSGFILKPVEESYLKQKNFITNASHDIKTPLTVIGAETDVIDMQYGENEYTKEIKKQIGRLAALTEKLIFLSRMEESPAYEFTNFDLSATIEEIAEPYRQIARAKGFAFSAKIRRGVTVSGNEDLLRQAAALLLDNALKYTKQGGEIVIELKKTGKSCELCFVNDVENLSAGKHDELFERFYRNDKSRDSREGGNGIGLSVVKAIVRLHKGKIGAYSEDGTKIKFVLVL